MARFFFDIDDGERLFVDNEGTECRDLEAAITEAVAVLPELARDRVRGGDQRDLVATVRHERGQPLFRARLSLTTERLDGAAGA